MASVDNQAIDNLLNSIYDGFKMGHYLGVLVQFSGKRFRGLALRRGESVAAIWNPAVGSRRRKKLVTATTQCALPLPRQESASELIATSLDVVRLELPRRIRRLCIRWSLAKGFTSYLLRKLHEVL